MRVPAPLHAPPGRVGVTLAHPVMVPSKRQVAVFTVGVPAYCVTVPGCATAVMRNGEPALWTVPPLAAVLLRFRGVPPVGVVQVASVALTVMLLGRIAKLSAEQPTVVSAPVAGKATRTRAFGKAFATLRLLRVPIPLAKVTVQLTGEVVIRVQLGLHLVVASGGPPG